jgi:hypothetical protein
MNYDTLPELPILLLKARAKDISGLFCDKQPAGLVDLLHPV